jgi:hypothetical protein
MKPSIIVLQTNAEKTLGLKKGTGVIIGPVMDPDSESV